MSLSAQREHPLERIEGCVQLTNRQTRDAAFRWFCASTAMASILILVILLGSILVQGISWLSPHFLTHYPEPTAEMAGIGPAFWGTIWVCVVCGIFALPIGVATAIFLEEYQPLHSVLRVVHSFVQLNINNLAGVPSVVYGILGLTMFVGMAGLFGSVNDPKLSVGVTYFDQFLSAGDKVLLIPVTDPSTPRTVATPGMKAMDVDGNWVDVLVVDSRRKVPRDAASKKFALVAGRTAGRIEKPKPYYFRLPFGRSVIAGALTLMLVILPIVIVSAQEAIRGVPSSLREAGLGLGATKWQVIRNVTLPAAIPGIMTGSILAMSRAIGEAAPILILAGAIFITTMPSSMMDEFTVMPLQIYDWAGRPQKDFHGLAAAGIIVLLAILFAFNSAAVWIRLHTQRKLS